MMSEGTFNAAKDCRWTIVVVTCCVAAASLASFLWLEIHRTTANFSPTHHDATAVYTEADEFPGQSTTSSRPATVVKPISCEKLADVPGKMVTTAVVDFPPNAYSPAHRHPGSVTAFVLRGTLRSQLAGGPVGTYAAGETWFEPPGAQHLFAENASRTEPAQILTFFVTDEDCGPLVVPER